MNNDFLEKIAKFKKKPYFDKVVDATDARKVYLGPIGDVIEGRFEEVKPKNAKRGPKNAKVTKGRALGIHAAKKLPKKAKIALGIGGLTAAGGAGYGISRAVKKHNQEKAAAEIIDEGLEKIALTRGAKELFKAQDKLRKITANGTKNIHSPEADKLTQYMDKVNPYTFDKKKIRSLGVNEESLKKIPPRRGFGHVDRNSLGPYQVPTAELYMKKNSPVENKYRQGAHKNGGKTIHGIVGNLPRDQYFDLMQTRLVRQQGHNKRKVSNYL